MSNGIELPKAVGEYAVEELERLRTRLAKYEDAEGLPIVDAQRLLDWNRAQPEPSPIVIGREYQVAEACASLCSSTVSAGMCNADDPASRCICREEFGHRVCAPSAGEQVRGLPECVRDWFEAKKAHVKAVGDYSARLAFVKQHMPFGTSVDPEYQIMEAADRKVRDLVWPMFVGLVEIDAPSEGSQQGGE